MASSLAYQSGFGNEFASEAVPGSLPVGRNSPQRPAHGLYAELLSGTAFTAPRAVNRRTWMYRRRPSVTVGAFMPFPQPTLKTDARDGIVVAPDPLRWLPLPMPDVPVDFFEGLNTMLVNGDVDAQTGVAVHLYAFNASMERRVFVNADGEMLLVPQEGTLRVVTELGVLEVAPGEIVLLPRGMAFSVDVDGPSRGYACENHGAAFRLPELGPIGSNGLANPRDFLAPVAAFDAGPEVSHAIIRKQGGKLWGAMAPASPFDVVAWHGNLVPCKYDTAHFNALGSVSFDHPDPSIFTVLTSPSDTPGVANCDFVIFPPRWMVAENTFRPPWYHRNTMSECMGLVHGRYDAKAEGFLPGGLSLHNAMVPHGPDTQAWEQASQAQLAPHKIDGTLAFMFESRYRFLPTALARDIAPRDEDYAACWSGLKPAPLPKV